jgi:hypothetical protein
MPRRSEPHTAVTGPGEMLVEQPGQERTTLHTERVFMTDRAKPTKRVPCIRYGVGADALRSDMVAIRDLIRCDVGGCGRNIHKDDVVTHNVYAHGIHPQ